MTDHKQSNDRRENIWSRIKSRDDVMWIKRMENKGQMVRSENMKALFSQDEDKEVSF